MANISSAHGTLFLEGGWSKEDIDALIPVLDCWEFYGEYGIQSYYRCPTVNNPKTDFFGCGRWSFSSTLESFHDWTLGWIKNHNEPLSQEQYDQLLGRMKEGNLSIKVDFYDREEGVGFDIHEEGRFLSDGESLHYETLLCEQNIPDWTEDFDRSDFDNAVKYFCALAPDGEEAQIRKWVKLHVGPTNFFSDGPVYLGDIWLYGDNIIGEQDMLDFRDNFNPQSDAWDEAVSSAGVLEWDLTQQSEEAALFQELAGSGQNAVSVNVELKPTVVHNGSNGMLEEGISLGVMSFANGAIITRVDELQNREGAEVPIVGMVFRLDPEGNFSRVANDFDSNNCPKLAGKVEALEARFGGTCHFYEIFAIDFAIDNDDGNDQQLEGYFDFLQGVLELLLGIKLNQKMTQVSEMEIPHFLDAEGNEYFLGFEVFVVKTELPMVAVGPDGQELDLTDEQREVLMRKVFQRAQLEWTEEDQEWYDNWEGIEPDWPTVELTSLDFKGKRFVLTGEFQHAPDDRDKIKAMIEARGGKCTSSVSGKTDYLVLGACGDVGAGKVEKAQEQQEKGSPIQIISEDTLFRFLN